MIGQNDSLQKHTHETDLFLTYPKEGYGLGTGSLWMYSINVSNGTSEVKSARVSNETRSKNLTVKYWKRTA